MLKQFDKTTINEVVDVQLKRQTAESSSSLSMKCQLDVYCIFLLISVALSDRI